MTHHFHPKVYQKLIIFLILCSLWIGPKRIWVGEKAKTCLSKFDIKFLVFVYFSPCVISRIVTLNSACWCILHNRYCLPLEFFSNIISFSYFLDRQNPDFFPFSNSQFLQTGTRRTYVHPFDLDYWAKTRYQPIFRHCFGAVLQYLAIFYENLH